MITGHQVRAARRLLGWTQQDLAASIGVSATAISDFEIGVRIPSVLNLSELRQVLKTAGVEFDEGEAGVKLRPEGCSILAWDPQTD